MPKYEIKWITSTDWIDSNFAPQGTYGNIRCSAFEWKSRKLVRHPLPQQTKEVQLLSIVEIELFIFISQMLRVSYAEFLNQHVVELTYDLCTRPTKVKYKKIRIRKGKSSLPCFDRI